jgi:hypothetical protein
LLLLLEPLLCLNNQLDKLKDSSRSSKPLKYASSALSSFLPLDPPPSSVVPILISSRLLLPQSWSDLSNGPSVCSLFPLIPSRLTLTFTLSSVLFPLCAELVMNVVEPCWVCGTSTANACGPCRRVQNHIFFCSRECQQLVRFCLSFFFLPAVMSSVSSFRHPPFVL